MKKINSADLCYDLRPTPFGPVAVMWSLHRGRPMISRVVLSKPGARADGLVAATYPEAIPVSCPEIEAIAGEMAAFLAGEDIRFGLDLARLDLCSEFQRRVLGAEHGIPRGRVSTYGRIAGHLGRARAARAVGTALANNPFPLIIPCHRAIRADGGLGGFQGGFDMKRRLLEMEEVPLDSHGKVVGEEFFFYGPVTRSLNHPLPHGGAAAAAPYR